MSTIGRSGRNAGQFHWVHNIAIDSKGTVFTTEVDNGKRIQRWVPTNGAPQK
jgi:sugar lactone lactonase YvrE